MSVDNFVFLRCDRLPTRESLQSALDAAQTGITLDPIKDLRAHSGYWPAKFKGHESGFEWMFGPIADTFGEKLDNIGDRDSAVVFSTFSDIRELACALYVAGTLAKISDGLVYDEEVGDVTTSENMLDAAREIEENEL